MLLKIVDVARANNGKKKQDVMLGGGMYICCSRPHKFSDTLRLLNTCSVFFACTSHDIWITEASKHMVWENGFYVFFEWFLLEPPKIHLVFVSFVFKHFSIILDLAP